MLRHTLLLSSKQNQGANPRIGVISHPPYAGSDLAPPPNYHLFCSMPHFLRLRGRTFDSLEVVLENGCRRGFLVFKVAEWYCRGIEQLAQSRIKVIKIVLYTQMN